MIGMMVVVLGLVMLGLVVVILGMVVMAVVILGMIGMVVINGDGYRGVVNDVCV